MRPAPQGRHRTRLAEGRGSGKIIIDRVEQESMFAVRRSVSSSTSRSALPSATASMRSIATSSAAAFPARPARSSHGIPTSAGPVEPALRGVVKHAASSPVTSRAVERKKYGGGRHAAVPVLEALSRVVPFPGRWGHGSHPTRIPCDGGGAGTPSGSFEAPGPSTAIPSEPIAFSFVVASTLMSGISKCSQFLSPSKISVPIQPDVIGLHLGDR